MGILGKILLVINVLAGAGFAFLAVQDWKGRQATTAATIRFALLRDGVPLDGGPDTLPARAAPTTDHYDDYAATEIPFAMELGGRPVGTVSPELLYVYFSAAGGASPAAAAGALDLGGTAPVASQLAEVKRVYALIQGQLGGKAGAEKATAAAGYLLFQAETIEERTAILGLLAEGNGDELARRLGQKFDRVISPPSRPDVSALAPAENPDAASLKDRLTKTAEVRDAGVKSADERRVRVAHLLAHLDPSAAWQKRVMLVVGVRRYVTTVVDQTARFRIMAGRVERTIADDQDRFVGEYAQLRALSIRRTQEARDVAENRAQLADQKKTDEEFVAQRQTQLASLRAQLAAVKAEVDQLLAAQSLTERQLFEVQREVGLTLEEIYRREAELASKERERYGAK